MSKVHRCVCVCVFTHLAACACCRSLSAVRASSAVWVRISSTLVSLATCSRISEVMFFSAPDDTGKLNFITSSATSSIRFGSVSSTQTIKFLTSIFRFTLFATSHSNQFIYDIPCSYSP